MTLRAGRADLFERLDAATKLSYAGNGIVTVDIRLVEEARDAVLQCPVDGCAYCYAVDQREATR